MKVPLGDIDNEHSVRQGKRPDLWREGGRRFTDLGRYGPRREKSWEYSWPSVHRPWPLLTRGERDSGRWCTDPDRY